MTIREIVKNLQSEVQNSKDLLPQRASEILSELSALIGNINDEIRVRDMEYNKVLLGFLETDEKANRAKIKAECTPEYNFRREARDTKELAIEMIRSLKYFLKAREEEYQVGRNSI